MIDLIEASEPTASVTPDEEPSSPVPSRRRPRATNRLLVGLAVLLVLAVAGAATMLVLAQRARAVDDASTRATSAARSAATTLLSYDYRHLATNFAAGRRLTTGPFADQY